MPTILLVYTNNTTTKKKTATFSPTPQSVTTLPTLQLVSISIYCTDVTAPHKSIFYFGFVLTFAAIGDISFYVQEVPALIVEMSTLGLDMVSDIVYILSLYSSHSFIALATVMLVVRLIPVHLKQDSLDSSSCNFILVITLVSTVLVVVVALFKIVFQVSIVSDIVSSSTTKYC